MTQERAELVRHEARKSDAVLDAHAVASERAQRAWRTRRAIEAGERPPLRRARARCLAVDGPFAGKTLLLERDVVASDEWIVPGAVYRFADAPGGRIAYLANSDPFLPIIGWRGWSFAHEQMGDTARRLLPLLRSMTAATVWPGGAPLAATCDSKAQDAHPDAAPARDCGCGIYATMTHHALLEAGHGLDDVVGLLAGWGRIIEHEHGYRFARAYPVLLVVTSAWTSLRRPQLVRELRRTYSVPVASTGDERVHDVVVEFIAGARADLPEWVYRALPPDLRAAGLEHNRRTKKEKADG